jgi:uncharacterized protein YeaO (DUF488 family)
MTIELKRAYEKPSSRDGFRVLVDRMWPRGVRKDELKIDEWLKDASPSTELRKWFGHDPARYSQFKRRYKSELRKHPEAIESLRHKAVEGRLTLVYSAKDEQHNNATVLKELIESH